MTFSCQSVTEFSITIDHSLHPPNSLCVFSSKPPLCPTVRAKSNRNSRFLIVRLRLRLRIYWPIVSFRCDCVWHRTGGIGRRSFYWNCEQVRREWFLPFLVCPITIRKRKEKNGSRLRLNGIFLSRQSRAIRLRQLCTAAAQQKCK